MIIERKDKGGSFVPMSKVVIALNGELRGEREEYKKLIGNKNILFIAADDGALLLGTLGFLPDVIIGDFGSLTKV